MKMSIECRRRFYNNYTNLWKNSYKQIINNQTTKKIRIYEKKHWLQYKKRVVATSSVKPTIASKANLSLDNTKTQQDTNKQMEYHCNSIDIITIYKNHTKSHTPVRRQTQIWPADARVAGAPLLDFFWVRTVIKIEAINNSLFIKPSDIIYEHQTIFFRTWFLQHLRNLQNIRLTSTVDIFEIW
jgi:hypothetical protein